MYFQGPNKGTVPWGGGGGGGGGVVIGGVRGEIWIIETLVCCFCVSYFTVWTLVFPMV